jgi:hypothetical protein
MTELSQGTEKTKPLEKDSWDRLVSARGLSRFVGCFVVDIADPRI